MNDKGETVATGKWKTFDSLGYVDKKAADPKSGLFVKKTMDVAACKDMCHNLKRCSGFSFKEYDESCVMNDDGLKFDSDWMFFPKNERFVSKKIKCSGDSCLGEDDDVSQYAPVAAPSAPVDVGKADDANPISALSKPADKEPAVAPGQPQSTQEAAMEKQAPVSMPDDPEKEADGSSITAKEQAAIDNVKLPDVSKSGPLPSEVLGPANAAKAAKDAEKSLAVAAAADDANADADGLKANKAQVEEMNKIDEAAAEKHVDKVRVSKVETAQAAQEKAHTTVTEATQDIEKVCCTTPHSNINEAALLHSLNPTLLIRRLRCTRPLHPRLRKRLPSIQKQQKLPMLKWNQQKKRQPVLKSKPTKLWKWQKRQR